MTQQQYQSCIEACNNCAAACDYCAASCLQEQDVTSLAHCIANDIDCAQVCRVCVGLMQRGSKLAAGLCDACADICDACADECEQHSHQHCKDCAAACRRCASECRSMSGISQSQVRPATIPARH
jgi:hypothetical protein